jgi:hypothetical protein
MYIARNGGLRSTLSKQNLKPNGIHLRLAENETPQLPLPESLPYYTGMYGFIYKY